MLSDVHLVERARRMIREEKTAAEWAVRKSLDQIQAVFEQIEDPYFRDRKSDVALVGERLLRTLVGRRESTSAEEAPKGSIAVAHELSPADAAQLGRAEAAGFCTEGGGRTSHTAIVARALGLPYVVGVEGLGHKVWSGMTIVIDGLRGEVILDPDAEALRRYEARADVHRERAQPAGGHPRRALADPATARRSTCTPTSRCWRRSRSPSIWAPSRWGCSAPSSSTSSAASCRPKMSSTRTPWRRSGAWAAGPSPSARSIWAATSCRRRCACRSVPTPPWGCARSATRSAGPTSSASSSARSTGRPRWGRCRSCFRSSRAWPSCAQAKRSACEEVRHELRARGDRPRRRTSRWAS